MDVRWTDDVVGPLDVHPVHLAVAKYLEGPRFDCVLTRTLVGGPSEPGRSTPTPREAAKTAPTAEEVAQEIDARMGEKLRQQRAMDVVPSMPQRQSQPQTGIIRRHFVSRARRLCHLTPLDVATICVALHQATAPPFLLYFPFVSVRDFARRSTLPPADSLNIGLGLRMEQRLLGDARSICTCIQLRGQSDIFMCDYQRAMTIHGSRAKGVPVFASEDGLRVQHTRLFLSSLAHLG